MSNVFNQRKTKWVWGKVQVEKKMFCNFLFYLKQRQTILSVYEIERFLLPLLWLPDKGYHYRHEI